MKSYSVLATLVAVLAAGSAKPADFGVVPVLQHPLYYTHALPVRVPHASGQTTVVRDALGNQGTAYAYQSHDGLSASVVAVSRSDNSKTLAFLPATAAIAPPLVVGAASAEPVVYAQHHYQPQIFGTDGVPVPAAAYSEYYV